MDVALFLKNEEKITEIVHCASPVDWPAILAARGNEGY